MSDYHQQFARVRRYYERLKQLNEGMVHTASSDFYIDDIYGFFQNCYHLKDWLKNDSHFTKYTSQQIEDYISNTPALAICADICNGSKHLKFNSSTRSGAEPKLGKKVIAVEVTNSLSGEEVPTKIKMQVEVEHDGNVRDAFALATDVLRAWESFIN